MTGQIDFGASKSMVLSFMLHAILGVGLFAFDGLAAKPWRQLGAATSGPSLIEIEMVGNRKTPEEPAPIVRRNKREVSPPTPEDSEKDVLQKQQLEVVTKKINEQIKSSPTSTVNTVTTTPGSGVTNSDSVSAVTSSPSKLAEAELVYLNDLRQLLESKKEYPIAARRMGHRGRVVVRFVLERDGRVRTAEIVQGSQSEILNRAARGLIGRLHDVKPFPKEVALTEWAVVVPIEYQM